MPIISKENFVCDVCDICKPIRTNGGTGYGNYSGKIVCYDCCADIDRADMIETGRAFLYLTRPQFASQYHCNGAELTNWPGTLTFKTGPIRIGRHNIAGKRYDVWFTGPDGKRWHGTQYGDNTQICRCRRVKSV